MDKKNISFSLRDVDITCDQVINHENMTALETPSWVYESPPNTPSNKTDKSVGKESPRGKVANAKVDSSFNMLYNFGDFYGGQQL